LFVTWLVDLGFLIETAPVQIYDFFVAIEEDDSEGDQEREACCHEKGNDNLSTLTGYSSRYTDCTYTNASNIRVRFDGLVSRAAGVVPGTIEDFPRHGEC
jgi:hypothetical protein